MATVFIAVTDGMAEGSYLTGIFRIFQLTRLALFVEGLASLDIVR